MSIQIFSFHNIPVQFENSGYLNATAIAEHFGKRASNYLKSERTQEYISALVERLFKFAEAPKRASAENQIVIIKKGGNNKKSQGTWLHPKLAVDFARWLDPKFAVWCDEQIEQILSGSQSNQKTTSTIEEREPLRKAISHLVVKHGLNFSDAYRLVHQRFNIENISELPRESLNDAIHYVHSLTVDKTLYGEVLDRLALPEPKKGVYVDEEEYHYLKMLTEHAPYLIAYFKRTSLAVSELNRDIIHKMGVHIHNSVVATYGLEEFNRIPITWQDAYRDFF